MEGIKYKTGSRAFFDGIEGFTPHDSDWVMFRKRAKYNTIVYGNNETTFIWKYNTADEMIEYLLNLDTYTNAVTVFLLPEVIDVIGMTFDKLPQLAPLVTELDSRHKYIEVIYNAYLENGDFTLTEEQLQEAYHSYQSARGLGFTDSDALKIITQGE